ncbi:checkpoint protein Hus1/Mec3 [Roridomyces roridus]|uniref:Checkpoint protein n=1 Tax=Roridomyces roridus TaxID=1738132 RepID=A0AAD7CL18_9AGAR|nr:checkpoint protein Hus1/Mec3 [Roridomyces roridus]
MRFRATIENVNTFFRIIQAIEKLQKKCIIKFSEEVMSIICNSETNDGGIQVWSQIKVDSLFTSYRIQSCADNVITMALASEALLAALRSASQPPKGSAYETEEIIMKLAKKNDHAVLTFEIIGMSRQGRKMRVAHDVKIEVLKPADVANLKEPMCPEPDVHIILPPLQKIRPIVERLRPMSDFLAVRANNNGRLQLAIRTDSVSVDTEWRNCKNTNQAPSDSQNQRDPDADEDAARDPDQLFSVLVSTKSFFKFLNSHVVSTTTIACICQNHCMILYVYVGDLADAGGVLTFYIPGQLLDD